MKKLKTSSSIPAETTDSVCIHDPIDPGCVFENLRLFTPRHSVSPGVNLFRKCFRLERMFQVTYKLKEGRDLLGLKVLDHVILTKDGFYSFADEGIL